MAFIFIDNFVQRRRSSSEGAEKLQFSPRKHVRGRQSHLFQILPPPFPHPSFEAENFAYVV